MKLLPCVGLLLLALAGCQKEFSAEDGDAAVADGPSLIFKFVFDSTQARLNNLGEPATLPAGHAALSPLFEGMSAHYVELAPNRLTPLGRGAILYHAPETNAGGAMAIDFSKAVVAAQGETFLKVPLRSIAPGSYEWLRLSLAFQRYQVRYSVDTSIGGVSVREQATGTVASFIGYNTYLSSFRIQSDTVVVNDDRRQGFWAFETAIQALGQSFRIKQTGLAPEGATTVPNPLFNTSPVPAGSCVVTAAFAPGALVVTGAETEDRVVMVNLSTNKSFEWQDIFPNGRWEPLRGERVVDMGIRGMMPAIQ